KRAGADDLIARGKVNDKWGRIGLISLAQFLPFDFASQLVESHDVLHIQAIAANDQKIVVEHWRTARTMLPVIVLEPSLPDDFTGLSDAGGSVGAEVQIDAITFEHRRRRREAVFRTHRSEVLEAKHLDVLSDRAAVSVYTNRAQ